MTDAELLKVNIHVAIGNESNQHEATFELQQGEIDSRLLQGLDASVAKGVVNNLVQKFNKVAGNTDDPWTIENQRNFIKNADGEWEPRY